MTELRNGKYRLLRTLGEGSQAETWEARVNDPKALRPDPANLKRDFDTFVRRAKGEAKHDHNPRGLVAIKCFRVNKAKAWKDVELAEREATTLATLDHPNLPEYLEHFEEDGALYLVMEKIEGDCLAPGKTQDVDVPRMLADIGDALRYLHGRTPSLVHRDVKPGNIIRRPDGSYVLVDLGAVRDKLKPTGGSTVVGTFGYMAPEQFQGRASTQSDLYGLGATALAMITGRQPEDLPHEGLGIDVKASVPRGTSRALVKALEAMLAPDPNHRAESIDDVLALLREPRDSKKEKPRKEKKRRRKERRERRERRPRPARQRREHSSPGWTLAIFSVIFAMFVTYRMYHRWYFLVAGGLLIAAIAKLRQSSERAREAPQIRVAEQQEEEEQARVRIAAEETYETEEEDEEEEQKPSGKLRR